MNKYTVLGVVIIVGVIGGVYFLRPASSTTGSAQSTTPQTDQFDVVVQQRKVVGGQALFTAKQGDTVSITITADESDELHLHGYDKHVDFSTSTPATLTFVADQSGRFPFEMEGSKTDLGELDVLP